MSYDLVSREEVSVLKYELRYSYSEIPSYPTVQFSDPITGAPVIYQNGVASSYASTSAGAWISSTVTNRAIFKLYRSKDNKRLVFTSPGFGYTVWTGEKICRKFKITHTTEPSYNNVPTDQTGYSLANSIVFSLKRNKLKVFAVDAMNGYITDITLMTESINNFLQMCYGATHPRMPNDVHSSMVSIITKELLGMALKIGMDVDYLLHSYRVGSPDHIMQHLASPFLMSQRMEHMIFSYPHMYPEIVTYKSLKGAIKRRFGRCNSNLLREVGKYLRKHAVRTTADFYAKNVPGAGIGIGTAGTYTYNVVYSGEQTSNRSPIYIMMDALKIIEDIPYLFQSLDYQDKYIGFFLNSVEYTPYTGMQYNMINTPSLSLIAPYPENKRWRLLTEDNDDSPDQGIADGPPVRKVYPWTNLNLLRDTWSQLQDFPIEKIPVKLQSEYPLGLNMPAKWDTLKDLHDRVSKDYNRIKAEVDNKAFTHDPDVELLDGTIVLDTVFVLPPDTATLVTWGKELHNCIASYADKVLKGKTIVFGLYKDGVPYINGEVNPETHAIIQLRVDYNREAPANYREKVTEIWNDMRKYRKLGLPKSAEDHATLINIVNNMENDNHQNDVLRYIGVQDHNAVQPQEDHNDNHARALRLALAGYNPLNIIQE